MRTQRLYHEDGELLETTARLLSVTETEGGFTVVPDQTVIFPGGGGQPADRGYLEEEPILASEARGETVAHRVAKLPPGVSGGAEVRLRVDAQWRRESSQQHTGQHLVSAALLQVAGIETISVHMGEDTLTVESPTPAVDADVLRKTQTLVNEVIRDNRPVRIHLVRDDELERFRLRRPAGPRDLHRVVEIQGFDASACGGVHVRSTAVVGLAVWVGSEKIRGNTRTHWLVGDRAWHHLEQAGETVRTLGQELSAAAGEVLEAVRRLRTSGVEMEKRAAALELAAARAYAERLAPRGTLPPLVTGTFDDLDGGVFRALVKVLSACPGVVALIVNRKGETAQVAATRAPDRAVELDAALRPHLHLAAITGGGKGGVWQGVARNSAGLETFVDALRDTLGRENKGSP